jgi:hypothetical protein
MLKFLLVRIGLKRPNVLGVKNIARCAALGSSDTSGGISKAWGSIGMLTFHVNRVCFN